MREYNLYKEIERISVRTSMYTGEQTVSNIGSYLSGYGHAMDQAGVKEVTYPKFEFFTSWLKTKFNFASDTLGWANMILALAIGCDPQSSMTWERIENATEEEHLKSVTLFFSLVEEYKNNELARTRDDEEQRT